MTVCRYFVKGYCRFGDRCRFEHIKNDCDSYNQRNVGNYQEQYGRQEYEHSNYYHNDNYQRNDRYDSNYSRNYYQENQRSYSADKYQENYRYQSPTRSGAYDNQYRYKQGSYSADRYQENDRYQSPTRSGAYDNQYRYKQVIYYSERYKENDRYQSPTRSGAYDNQYRYKQVIEQQPRYNEYNYGRNQQHSSNYAENENAYGQNRFRWLSDDYKGQSQPSAHHNDNNYSQNSLRTSTPKGKVSFSFKVPESEIKKDSSNLLKISEQDQLYAEHVIEEAKSWELGKQWPFTCYFPSTDKHGYPGFYDVSPEELRYAAYSAEKNNSYESYVQAVQKALAQVNQQRSELQVATPQLLSTLRRIRNGEDLYSTSKMINPICSTSSTDNIIESMETVAFSTSAAGNAAASFSFKLPETETDSVSKTGASNFSFKLPAGTEIKVVPSSVSDGDTNIYTPMGNLTEEEKEQFCASTFALGKIPTKPPPQVLCT